MKPCLLLLFCLLALSTNAFSEKHAPPVKIGVVEVEKPGRENLEVTVRGKKFTVPDEDVSGFNEGLNTYPHEFQVAPTTKWFLVTRKCMSGVNVGYAYVLMPSKVVPLRVNGLRFDAAAWRYFVKTLGVKCAPLETGTRILHFDRWDRQGNLYFDLVGPSGQAIRPGRKDNRSIISAVFHYQTKRFQLLKHVVDKGED